MPPRHTTPALARRRRQQLADFSNKQTPFGSARTRDSCAPTAAQPGVAASWEWQRQLGAAWRVREHRHARAQLPQP